MTTRNKQFTAARGRTSMRLEPELLEALADIAERERTNVSAWIRGVEAEAGGRDLTSAVRVAILQYYRALTPPP